MGRRVGGGGGGDWRVMSFIEISKFSRGVHLCLWLNLSLGIYVIKLPKSGERTTGIE